MAEESERAFRIGVGFDTSAAEAAVTVLKQAAAEIEKVFKGVDAQIAQTADQAANETKRKVRDIVGDAASFSDQHLDSISKTLTEIKKQLPSDFSKMTSEINTSLLSLDTQLKGIYDHVNSFSRKQAAASALGTQTTQKAQAPPPKATKQGPLLPADFLADIKALKESSIETLAIIKSLSDGINSLNTNLATLGKRVKSAVGALHKVAAGQQKVIESQVETIAAASRTAREAGGDTTNLILTYSDSLRDMASTSSTAAQTSQALLQSLGLHKVELEALNKSLSDYNKQVSASAQYQKAAKDAKDKAITDAKAEVAAAELQAKSTELLARKRILSSIAVKNHQDALERLRKAQLSLIDAEGKGAKSAKELMTSQERLFLKVKEMFGRLGIFSIATATIYGIVNAFQAMIDKTIQVEHDMIQLEKVMDDGLNFEKIEKGFFGIAKRLGLEIRDVLRAGKIFAQQGLAQVDVLNLTETALIAVATADLSEQQAVEALTAARKIFNIESSKSISVIDKLTAVEIAHAVTAQDLADSIRIIGPVVKVLHGNIDDVIGITTALVAVSRKSGREVGNSLKTVLARFTTPSVRNKFLEVAKIDVKATEKAFKPLGTLLGEVARKWTTLSNAEQSAIALSAGGARRYQDFIILMENYSEALAATILSKEAENAAERVRQKEMESTFRKLKQLTAAYDEFTTTTVKNIGGLPGIKHLAEGLTLINEALAKISQWNAPAGALISVTALVTAFTGLDWIVRRVLFAYGATNVPLKTFVRQLYEAGKTAKWAGPILAGLRVAGPWILGAAAIGFAIYATKKYIEEGEKLRSGQKILDDVKERWTEIGVVNSEAEKQLSAYIRVLKDLGRADKLELFKFTLPTQTEINKAQKVAKDILSGKNLKLDNDRDFGKDPLLNLPEEALADIEALKKALKGTDADTDKFLPSEFLQLTKNHLEHLQTATSKLRGDFAKLFNLEGISDAGLNVIGKKLENPARQFNMLSTEIKALESELEREQVTKVLAEIEEKFGGLKLPSEEVQKAAEEMRKTWEAQGRPRVGGGFVLDSVDRGTQERINSLAETQLLYKELAKAIFAAGKVEKVYGLAQTQQDAWEEYEEVLATVRDRYFEITHPVKFLLDNVDKQRRVFGSVGEAIDSYERKLNIVKNTIAELSDEENALAVNAAMAKHALDQFDQGLKSSGKNANLSSEITKRTELERKYRDALEEQQKLRERTNGKPIQEYAAALYRLLEPERLLSEENKQRIRSKELEITVTENLVKQQTKFQNLQKYGQEVARTSVENAMQEVDAAYKVYDVKLSLLELEKEIRDIGDNEFQNRKRILDFNTREAQALSVISAWYEAIEKPLQRSAEHTRFVKENLQSALADWEGIVSGSGIRSFIDSLARKQREIWAESIIQALQQAKTPFDKLFDDPVKRSLEAQAVAVKTFAEQLAQGLIDGSAAGAAIFADIFRKAGILSNTPAATPVASGGVLGASAGALAKAVIDKAHLPDRTGVDRANTDFKNFIKAQSYVGNAQAEASEAQKAISDTFMNRLLPAINGIVSLAVTSVIVPRANSPNALRRSTLAQSVAKAAKLNPWATLGLSLGGAIFGGLIGRQPEQVAAVEENTRALNSNTQALNEIQARVFNAPSTFLAPSVKGAGGGGGIVLQITNNISASANMSEGKLADAVARKTASAFGASLSRNGSRSRSGVAN